MRHVPLPHEKRAMLKARYSPSHAKKKPPHVKISPNPRPSQGRIHVKKQNEDRTPNR